MKKNLLVLMAPPVGTSMREEKAEFTTIGLCLLCLTGITALKGRASMLKIIALIHITIKCEFKYQKFLENM